jgi:hypothetical protein
MILAERAFFTRAITGQSAAKVKFLRRFPHFRLDDFAQLDCSDLGKIKSK